MQQRILIIDDQIETINFIVDCFYDSIKEYEFYHALNGINAIEVARKFSPKLIIIDWEMPGMSGIDTIKRLKSIEATKDIPVIMLTGIMTSSENLKTALEAGAIDFIRKPIDKLELIARTGSMLMLANSYKEMIEFKNRELASTALAILQNNEFNINIINKLSHIIDVFGTKNNELYLMLDDINKEISQRIKGETWKNFETYFNNVHAGFISNLLGRFPNLSPAEIKLASLIRLQLSSKDIASIIFISVDSVKTARNRLRKKLNLSSEDNLTSYMVSL